VPVAERLHPLWNRSGRGSFKPMLLGFAPQRPRGRSERLPERRQLPQTLQLSQVEAILLAQHRVRDRFLFALLFQTGMRVGQALGLRHEDVVAWENRIEIVCRENANGARGKGGEGSVPARGWVPVHAALVPHTYATLSRRRGVPIDVISQLITHRSVQTTQQIYTHLDVEDLRAELERLACSGWSRIW
jgi:integrase/recombinase XerD